MRLSMMLLTTMLLTAFLGVIAAPSSSAVNSLAFTLLVPCSDEDGVSSYPLFAVTLPAGTYAYSIVGECSYGLGAPAPVDPAVSAACYMSVHAAKTDYCGDVPYTTGCRYRVEIDGQCVGYSPAGTVWHPGGAMTARFVDAPGGYYNNSGAFVVTLIFTPL